MDRYFKTITITMKKKSMNNGKKEIEITIFDFLNTECFQI